MRRKSASVSTLGDLPISNVLERLSDAHAPIATKHLGNGNENGNACGVNSTNDTGWSGGLSASPE